MALKANRGTVGAQQAPAQNEVIEAQVVNGGNEAPSTAVAPTGGGAIAPVGNTNLADLNAGILDNIDDLTGGNYVSVDGNQFLYKSTEEYVDDITCIITAGKRFYQWVEEDADGNKTFHNSDTKLNDNYKLKFEIRWLEEVDGEPTEMIMTLSTTSSMQFIDYVKKLAKKGVAVNQVFTKMTVSRQVNSKDKTIRYSRVEFEPAGMAQ